jgi:hypothetical protein
LFRAAPHLPPDVRGEFLQRLHASFIDALRLERGERAAGLETGASRFV